MPSSARGHVDSQGTNREAQDARSTRCASHVDLAAITRLADMACDPEVRRVYSRFMDEKPRLFGGRPVLEFSGTSDRRSFLRWAGLVGVGATLVAGGVGASAGAVFAAPRTGTQQDASDIDILNYALTLEYLESDFYMTGLNKGFLNTREMELVTAIGQHEAAHVTAVSGLVTQLGGTPVGKPKITYPGDTFSSKASFLKNASTFEELGVHAYHGQVPLIQSGDVLGAAASIAGVESRHAAILASLNQTNPFPAPIEQPKSKDFVLAQVKPYLA